MQLLDAGSSIELQNLWFHLCICLLVFYIYINNVFTLRNGQFLCLPAHRQCDGMLDHHHKD